MGHAAAVFGMCVQIRVFCFDKDIDGGSALFHQKRAKVYQTSFRHSPRDNGILDGSPSPASDEAVDEEHDDCANDSADQTRTFSWMIPPESLAKVSRHERSHDPQDGGENEACWLIVAGHDELGDHASDEANDNRPNYAHLNLSFPVNANR
jgi:hypothetical protein